MVWVRASGAASSQPAALLLRRGHQRLNPRVTPDDHVPRRSPSMACSLRVISMALLALALLPLARAQCSSNADFQAFLAAIDEPCCQGPGDDCSTGVP